MAKLSGWHHWRIWRLLGWPLGGALGSYSWVVRLTARARVRGPGAAYTQPAVYVSWHQHIPFAMIVHGRAHRWQLMSHAPYMEPIAVWSRLLGLRNARGTPQQRMRESLEVLVQALKRGESVAVFVDGPAGPPKRAKPGCVQVAQRAGVPLIALAYRTRSNARMVWRWDHAMMPLPFDGVDVMLGEPMMVPTDANPEVWVSHVDAALQAVNEAARAG